MKETLALLLIGFAMGAGVALLVSSKIASEIQKAKAEITSALETVLKAVGNVPAPSRMEKHAIAGTNPTPIPE